MKVYISKYRDHWFSPYPLVAKIFRTDDWDDPRVEKWAERLTPLSEALQSFLDFIYPRINYVKIDKWDTWGMDTTLASIIVPMLKQLKATKHGSPYVYDDDVPEELRSTSAPPEEDAYDIDANHHKRWDWAMDEMIWAFENILDDNSFDLFSKGVSDYKHEPCEWDENGKATMYKMVEGPNHTAEFDEEGYDKHHKRISHGTYLFGKYYKGLWD